MPQNLSLTNIIFCLYDFIKKCFLEQFFVRTIWKKFENHWLKNEKKTLEFNSWFKKNFWKKGKNFKFSVCLLRCKIFFNLRIMPISSWQFIVYPNNSFFRGHIKSIFWNYFFANYEKFKTIHCQRVLLNGTL